MIIEPDDKFIEIFAFIYFELGDALASSVIDKNGERVFRLRTRLYVDDKVFDSDDIKHFYTLKPNTDNPVEELKLLLDKLNEAVFDNRGKIDFNIVNKPQDGLYEFLRGKGYAHMQRVEDHHGDSEEAKPGEEKLLN